ncbi:hypothetical protein F4776DRAFT_10400 [Hypoxylon sp. NC0597]|nr:hypothetical protein F4776DRAFT_10400 [Hypoxylon sp. NC0597]
MATPPDNSREESSTPRQESLTPGVFSSPTPEPPPNSPRLSYAYPLITSPPPPPIPNHLPTLGNIFGANGIERRTPGNSFESNGVERPPNGLHAPIPNHSPNLGNIFEPNGTEQPNGGLDPPSERDSVEPNGTERPVLRSSLESNDIGRRTSGLYPPLPPWQSGRLERTGSCFCGAIQLRVYGRPLHTYLCYCERCKRISSTVFAAYAMYNPDVCR